MKRLICSALCSSVISLGCGDDDVPLGQQSAGNSGEQALDSGATAGAESSATASGTESNHESGSHSETETNSDTDTSGETSSGPDLVDACSSNEDCTASDPAATCYPPGVLPSCGSGPEAQCNAELACSDPADACHLGRGQCGGDVCGARCDFVDLSPGMPGYCSSSEICDIQVTGTCQPIACDSGYDCPAFMTCNTGSKAADAHGCVRQSCFSSSSCEGGECVLGRCYEQLGTCYLPAA